MKYFLVAKRRHQSLWALFVPLYVLFLLSPAVASNFPVTLTGGTANSLVVQPDGKLLIGGSFTNVSGFNRTSLVRLELDGFLDLSFDAAITGNVAVASCRSDGKIVVASFLPKKPNTYWFDLLGVTGTVDTNFVDPFNPQGVPATGVEFLPDDRLLVSGLINVGRYGNIIRLLSTGAADIAFKFEPAGYVCCFRSAADRSIVASVGASGTNSFRLVRVDPSGRTVGTIPVSDPPDIGQLAIMPDHDVIAVDGTNFLRFDSAGRQKTNFNLAVRPMGVRIVSQPDGKLLIYGATNLNGASAPNLFRVLNDGTVDPQFNGSFFAGQKIHAVLVAETNIYISSEITNQSLSIGKITRLSAGPFSGPAITAQPTNAVLTATNALCQYGGTLFVSVSVSSLPAASVTWFHDGAFAGTGAVLRINNARRIDEGIYTAVISNALGAIQSAPTIVSLGLPPGYPGAVDVEFPTGLSDVLSSGVVNASTRQADGKLLLGGSFTSFDDESHPYMVRLTTNGAIDLSFTDCRPNSPINDMVVDDANRVFLGGSFTAVNGLTRSYLARLKADGSLDETWTTDTDGEVNCLLRTPLGIVVGGAFTKVGYTTHRGLGRLDQNGDVDFTFNTQLVGGGSVNALANANDGGIFIAGTFNNVNGLTERSIARLLWNGTVDESFVPALVENGWVGAVAQQPDGRVLIGGNFKAVSQVSRPGLARLLTNGLLDETFDAGIGSTQMVRSIEVQYDGKILVAGDFSRFGGFPCSGVVRLLPTGEVDTNFVSIPGVAGGTNSVRRVRAEPEGRIMLVGGFTHYNGTPRGGIARLIGDLRLATDKAPAQILMRFPTVPGRNYVVEAAGEPSADVWDVRTNFTAINFTEPFTEARDSTNRFYRVRME